MTIRIGKLRTLNSALIIRIHTDWNIWRALTDGVLFNRELGQLYLLRIMLLSIARSKSRDAMEVGLLNYELRQIRFRRQGLVGREAQAATEIFEVLQRIVCIK